MGVGDGVGRGLLGCDGDGRRGAMGWIDGIDVDDMACGVGMGDGRGWLGRRGF